jgi:predicted permease
LFTEAVLISLTGGVIGLIGSVVLLRALSAWRPFTGAPLYVTVNPDAKVYLAALLLAIISGLLFGAVPVRQVLGTNPYEVIKAGSGRRIGKRLSARELLLVAQIAICAVLVTSSLVAVRGLGRSLHARFGFDLQNTMLAKADLTMGGYTGDRVLPMQKRMLHAMEAIPGVEAAALADAVPFDVAVGDAKVFHDNAPDLRPVNAAANAYIFHVSPGYFRAAGTTLLSGRDFSWQDDQNTPRVAVVNAEFARRLFGSVSTAIGNYYKLRDGTRIQVVGIAEDGKYYNLTEDPQAAQFVPILQLPSGGTTLIVRAKPGLNNAPPLLAAAMRKTMRELDAGVPVIIETREKPLEVTLFGPRMATVALGVLGLMGAMLSITGIFGMAATSVSRRLRELGIRVALGAQHKEVLQAALGRAVKLLMIGSAAGLGLGILAARVLAFVVYGATPRDPLVLTGVVLAMAVLGLMATWIPAQRALSVDPLVLLREE